MVRRGWDLLDKAVKLDPSVRDSAFRYRPVDISVPAKEDSIKPILAVDSSAMRSTLDRYDSLVRLISDLRAKNQEKGDDFFGDLAAAEKEKKTIQKRLAPAFIKDSTYRYEPDSSLEVIVHTRKGLVTGIGIHRRAFKAKGKVQTAGVNYDASKSQPFYRDPWFILSGCLFTLLVLLIVIVLEQRKHTR